MDRAIGVFDSGVGGLTVLRELNMVLPGEPTVYLGDNMRVPYGALPVEKIRKYTLQCLDHLYYCEGVKALVIACNTATATTLEIAQQRYDVPVVGVIESTAKAAVRTTRGRMGIIATVATVNSEAYLRAVRAQNRRVEVFQQACPLLSLQVEAGEFASRRTETVLEGYLHPLREKKVDTLVLGCTHYPFVRPLIEKLMGPEVQIVENGSSTVASLVALMEEGELEGATCENPVRRMMITGKMETFRLAAATLWPDGVPEIELVNVEGEVERVCR